MHLRFVTTASNVVLLLPLLSLTLIHQPFP